MRSMTGFAAVEGEVAEGRWRWELRSVNARGLEVRFRTPYGLESVEGGWRSRVGTVFSRGTVTASLTLDENRPPRSMQLNSDALDAAIEALKEAEARALAAGATLAPTSAADLLGLRGVMEGDAEGASGVSNAKPEALLKAIGESFMEALNALAASRAEEGARLKAVLSARIDEIAGLVAAARMASAARAEGASTVLAERVQNLLQAGAPIDQGRLAQELALLAVKSDVAEELDRLDAHVAAGRELLEAPPPVGRKLDFLTQEFNREANTLCAKSQDKALTETGLALKVAIDQLREQAANVE